MKNRDGEEKKGGEERGERRWQEETFFIRNLPLLSITKPFPLEEKHLTLVSNEVMQSANITECLSNPCMNICTIRVRGMAGRGRMEIKKLFGSTFLLFNYLALNTSVNMSLIFLI